MVRHRSSRRFWVGAAIFVAAFIFLAAIILLFVTARVQQGLLDQEPEYSSEQLYSRGLEQIDKGDYASAETYLEQALLKEDDATMRNQLAVVKYRLKKYSESIDLYKKAIDEGKDAAFAWNGIGNAYRDWAEQDQNKMAEYQKNAEEAYKKSIALNAGYVAAYSNLALLYENQDKHDEAIQALDEGIKATDSKDLQQIKDTLLKE